VEAMLFKVARSRSKARTLWVQLLVRVVREGQWDEVKTGMR